jgi:hypothetical protein
LLPEPDTPDWQIVRGSVETTFAGLPEEFAMATKLGLAKIIIAGGV